jgi:sulfate adenylyltransferase subunit 2
MSKCNLTQLEELEAESIHVLREAAAQFSNASLLFSGGKDSLVCLHLIAKAFYPANSPFVALHVDTGHNFPMVMKFRDEVLEKYKMKLFDRKVEDAIAEGLVQDETGIGATRNELQIPVLLDAIEHHKFDVCLGGARRDEEKARAKERMFSHRDDFGQWDPKNQRPEIWDLFNGRKSQDEHFRVFPISNWTELDVWNYIKKEEIPLPDLYFSHERDCYERDGIWYAYFDYIQLKKDEKIEKRKVRFRSIGDVTCTGACESEATTIDDIIAEVASATTTERGTRADDKKSDTSMEDRKQQGYF